LPASPDSSGRERPGWTEGASRAQAFRRGAAFAPSTPAVVLFATFIGFGALAQATGFSAGQAVFTTLTVWALPGQVVLVDQMAKGAGLAAAAFAVTLTAIRLLPLTVSLMPLLRSSRMPRAVQFLMSHFIAVTVWIEGQRRLPALPEELRAPYFLGMASFFLVLNLIATMIGFLIAGRVPTEIAAGLLFLTPIYFLLSLISSARGPGDLMALVVGFLLGPVLFLAVPGFDLLATGLIGGTAAYLAGKRRRRT